MHIDTPLLQKTKNKVKRKKRRSVQCKGIEEGERENNSIAAQGHGSNPLSSTFDGEKREKKPGS